METKRGATAGTPAPAAGSVGAHKVGYLSSMEVFRDLSADDLQLMERQVTMAGCGAGKIFYMPDDTGDVLFLLKKGRVQLYRISPSGKKLVVATLGPGAMFGEMALVGQRMHSTYAEAADDCLICVMSRADVERLLRDRPVVALRFLEVLGERVAQMEERLEDLAFKSIPARLAALLLHLAQEQGGAGAPSAASPIRISVRCSAPTARRPPRPSMNSRPPGWSTSPGSRFDCSIRRLCSRWRRKTRRGTARP